MSRYFRRNKAVNDSIMYEKYFKKKGRRTVEQYRTPVFGQVTDEVLDSMDIYLYIFSPGDAYWKISNYFYGDPSFWWVIASFNKKPTLSHLRPGDTIKVPVDLNAALEVLE